MKNYRRQLLAGLFLALFAVLWMGGCRQTNPGVPNQISALPSIVKSIEPAVARINTTGTGSSNAGSGFIIDSRGYLLTNNHLVADATDIKVTLLGDDVLPAILVANDTTLDLALIKLSSNRTNFPVVNLGASRDILVGQEVLAAGFPLGNELPGPATFHHGIVSALRTLNGQRYIQTDAVINPGNSGGCLVDLTGKVMGITTAGVVPSRVDAEAIGLVIPIDDVKPFIEDKLPKQ